ncbi:MAG TPA: hypothetical protein VFM58_16895, partial [Solirubrobacteraceae bacterium]|nr:hypothetical protein [Solirubrobacteraceae bacterium]
LGPRRVRVVRIGAALGQLAPQVLVGGPADRVGADERAEPGTDRRPAPGGQQRGDLVGPVSVERRRVRTDPAQRVDIDVAAAAAASRAATITRARA